MAFIVSYMKFNLKPFVAKFARLGFTLANGMPIFRIIKTIQKRAMMLPIYPEITSLRTYNNSRSAIIEKTDELIKSFKAIETVGDLKFMSRGLKERLMNVRNAFNQMRPFTASYFEGKTRTEKKTQDIHIHRKIKFLEHHFNEIVLPIVNKPHADAKAKAYVECYPEPYSIIEKDCKKAHTKLSDSITNIVKALSNITDHEKHRDKIEKVRRKILTNIENIDDVYEMINDNFDCVVKHINEHIEKSEYNNWKPKLLRTDRKIKELQKDIFLGKVSVIELLGNLLPEQDLETLKKHITPNLKHALSVSPKWLRKKFSNIIEKLSDTKIQQSHVEPMIDYVKQSWKIRNTIYQKLLDKDTTDESYNKSQDKYEELDSLEEGCQPMIDQHPILSYYSIPSTSKWLRYVKKDIDELDTKADISLKLHRAALLPKPLAQETTTCNNIKSDLKITIPTKHRAQKFQLTLI